MYVDLAVVCSYVRLVNGFVALAARARAHPAPTAAARALAALPLRQEVVLRAERVVNLDGMLSLRSAV